MVIVMWEDRVFFLTPWWVGEYPLLRIYSIYYSPQHHRLPLMTNIPLMSDWPSLLVVFLRGRFSLKDGIPVTSGSRPSFELRLKDETS